MSNNVAHDIIMEALDRMGQEVRIVTQAPRNGGVAISWGTISGVSERGLVAHVTVDDFRYDYASSERGYHTLVDATRIIEITPV